MQKKKKSNWWHDLLMRWLNFSPNKQHFNDFPVISKFIFISFTFFCFFYSSESISDKLTHTHIYNIWWRIGKQIIINIYPLNPQKYVFICGKIKTKRCHSSKLSSKYIIAFNMYTYSYFSFSQSCLFEIQYLVIVVIYFWFKMPFSS